MNNKYLKFSISRISRIFKNKMQIKILPKELKLERELLNLVLEF